MELNIEKWSKEELKSANFGDKRLNNRFEKLIDTFSVSPNDSIPVSCQSWTDTIAAYRFFNNNNVSSDKILSPHKELTIKRIQDQSVVLLLQDTTEFDFSRDKKIQGMGPLSYEHQIGFHLHPTIAVTPSRVCLGTIDSYAWAREKLLCKSRNRKAIPFEEKESYRWLLSYRASTDVAYQCPNTLIVNISDREGDIYEVLKEAQLNNDINKARVIMRANHDRCLVDNNGFRINEKLWEIVTETSPIANIEFDMQPRKGKSTRQVKQSIYSKQVWIPDPQSKAKKPPKIKVNAIACIERCPPEGEQPVQWILLTTLPTSTVEESLLVVKWYLCRWEIEIFFKILKSGCEVEKLQFETYEATLNCITLYMIVAWRIFYLTMVGRESPEISCEKLLARNEWQSVYLMTQKEKPPESAPSVGEMLKMIAKLGGHLGRKNDRLPGPKTMWIGIKRMRDFALAWDEILKLMDSKNGT